MGFGVVYFLNGKITENTADIVTTALNQDDEDKGGPEEQVPHSFSIEALRNGECPGSEIVV